MPWKTKDTKMELKQEFVMLADKPKANMSQLCRRYGISRPTGYKWLKRYRDDGLDGLTERSRRPRHSPNQTPEQIEELVLAARENDQGWGGRKLAYHLRGQAREGVIEATPEQIPAPSTITTILRRHGRLGEQQASSQQGPWQRFEREEPNQLWQMDFKGEFRLANNAWCYPLTIVDDHSRFGLTVDACLNQKRTTVVPLLKIIFRRYGLPEAILCDNGGPWGSPIRFPGGRPHYTKLAAWLMRLGVQVKYSRPKHPQSKGKNERFNGTLAAELLHFERFRDQAHAQARMSEWRERYNSVRPHEALDMATPASRYQPSPVELPDQLPPVEYGPDDATRKVGAKGLISFQGQSFRVGKAFTGFRVALRASSESNNFKVFFCNEHIRTITLNSNNK